VGGVGDAGADPGRAQEALAVTDWTSVGLVLAGVGAFLIGLAVLARGHRGLVEELLGARAPRLGRLRDAIFQRALLVVGFAGLAGGIALQLLGRFFPVAEPSFPVAGAGAIVAGTLVLLGLAWAYASSAARKAVRAHFAAHPRDLGTEIELAREIGELFGVESRPEDTVETYLERLQQALGLPARPRGPGAVPAQFDFDEHDEPR
jgi:hypothetical protein